MVGLGDDAYWREDTWQMNVLAGDAILWTTLFHDDPDVLAQAYVLAQIALSHLRAEDE